MRFSANLGYLFLDLPFVERIAAAARAGFDAVEFHDQAQVNDLRRIAAELQATGLPLLSINLRMGETAGCAAIPGSQQQFRQDLAHGLDVAERLGARSIHVLSGCSRGPDARAALIDNLGWALGEVDRMLLLEPICEAAIPGYHLHSLAGFDDVVAVIDDSRLRLMADWYHLSHSEGADALSGIEARRARLGHLQIARPRDRAEPMASDLPQWARLRDLAQSAGCGFTGLEYRPGRAPHEVLASLRAVP